MQGLSFITFFILGFVLLGQTQSPHGDRIKIDCASCHSPESWKFQENKAVFTHDSTRFSLRGQHQMLECRSCHTDLKFENRSMECNSCHVDMHNQTVGLSCDRCHNEQSWIVDNITEIHERTSFPLTGVHSSVNCNLCHQTETNIRFNPIGLNCIDCHRADFDRSKNPDHNKNKFSTECLDCHSLTERDWTTDRIDHSFFPLKESHEIQDCKTCHRNPQFSDISAACVSCHQIQYETSNEPNHKAAGFDLDCSKCHNLSPDWKPAQYLEHDVKFPIYSGKHKMKWVNCKDCHLNSSDYKQFSCTTCHENPETDEEHKNLGAYLYEDKACLACHPMGDADQSFDHNQSGFPLTGAHQNLECIRCHAQGYQGTTTNCVDCHQADFDGSKEPEHKRLGFSTDCASCHSTNPGWAPAKFDIHDRYYVLQGAHNLIRNECSKCHQNGFSNSGNTCIACHRGDYENTSNPDHQAAQFPDDCASCHGQSSWTPSQFDHDGQFFPIYSGKHKGQWTECKDCHTQSGNFKSVSCIVCHLNPETDQEHMGVGGYAYEDRLCLACHPAGDADMRFDHNTTAFPLTGAHITAACLDCHISGFKGTSTTCLDCHQNDYNASLDPQHIQLNIPTDCASCHTTAAGWAPAKFDIHDRYYILQGAHQLIKDDCKRCHVTGFNNTPNTCSACHQNDYDLAKDPDHKLANFPNDCASCHGQSSWTPSTFNHDGLYFPVYSGKHKSVWNQCAECHQNPTDFTVFNCISCHINPETDEKHLSVNSYVYQDQACLACHPTGDADQSFDHNSTGFPLTGGHQNINCLDCHSKGFKNTSADCFDCHQADFDQSQNPNHRNLALSTECIQCHTTDPGWAPAKFDIHDQYYVLSGAHWSIKNNCNACHQGNYNNTPNTCIACHRTDFDQTSNPNHKSAQFPEDCTDCHDQSKWVPSTFEHDGNYFPIYSGKHKAVWTQCIECHSNASNYAEVKCTGCHVNPDTDEEHQGVTGYFYQDNACLACHPTGDADFKFDHNNTMFPLTGAHSNTDCKACHLNGFKGTSTLCVDCHNRDYEQSQDPNHKNLNLSTDCASCHTTNPGWTPARFDQHNQYYTLDGAHALIRDDCMKCHATGFNNTPDQCVGCHQNQYDQSQDPDHKKLGLPTDCASCHTTAPGWAPAKFDIHDQYYPLKGAHAAIKDDCKKCHIGGYQNTANQCYGCHQPDYDQTQNPNHQTAQFPTDCASCHSESSWVPSTFNHDGLYFPVYSGTHKAVWTLCSECHTNPSDYKVFDCLGCHLNPETNDDHIGVGGYYYASFACLACHPTGEKKMAFDHNMSSFPLTGAHLNTDCLECHQNGFAGTPTDCASCHINDFNQSTNPNHVNLGIPTDCASCHTTAAGWAPASFGIHNNYWVLDGAHELISNNCAACHQGNYNNTPNTCVGCHLADFNGSTNPNHQSLGIPTDCASCHSTAPGWAPAGFDIHNNYWVIDGAHINIKDDCFTCHKGNYNNTPNTCVGCHLADFNGSTNPNHPALGIPQTCATCHSTDPGWAPAGFPIHDNYYPLVGAHALIANECALCHQGNYNNTPNTCFGCHDDDYNNTTNPDHQSAQFPTACLSCHNQSSWIPSSFDHDNMYFPIYSGKHDNEWTTCSECHTNPNDYSVFQCLTCHPQGEMNNEHQGVSGYSYNSAACFNCHPDGEK